MIKVGESSKKWFCELCNYSTSRSDHYKKHLQSLKHKTKENINIKLEKKWVCICGKDYKHQSSLWNHKQKCNFEDENKDKEFNELLLKLLNENKDLQNRMLEQENSINEFIKIYKKSI